MLVRVLRSPKKADTYLYLPLTATVDELPEPLQPLFSPEIVVTKLNISAERNLASITGVKLLEHLDTDGYYLQIPPPVESLLKRIN